MSPSVEMSLMTGPLGYDAILNLILKALLAQRPSASANRRHRRRRVSHSSIEDGDDHGDAERTGRDAG
jgi:hypothetical protein